jgi:GNAT superfamily N-acetyltransferase
MSPGQGLAACETPVVADLAGTLTVRAIELADTIELRSRVLRNHMPGVAAVAATDDSPATWHLGAFAGDRLVGVITGFAEAAPGHPGLAAERFRFMAVEPEMQGAGVGRALLDEVRARARERGTRLLWAKGRDTALTFYERLGFEVVGDGFVDGTSGLPHHVVMLWM